MNFKNVFGFIAVVFMCAVFSFSARAEYYGSSESVASERSPEKKPIQLQLMGSNVGFGGNVGYHINDMFFIGADFTSASLSDEETDSKGTVDIDVNFSTMVLMVRVSPFSGSFFLQGGLVNRSWKVEGDGESEVGNSNVKGRVKATVEFPSVAANLGIGWNWISDFGLSGGLGLGMITGGRPEADVEAGPLLALGGVNESDVKKEEENLEDKMAQFVTVPYVHLNIGWNF